MRLTFFEVVFVLCIIVGGIALEYVGEIVMSGSSPTSDVFPSQVSSFDSAIMLKINPGILNSVLNLIFETLTRFGSTLAIAFFVFVSTSWDTKEKEYSF